MMEFAVGVICAIVLLSVALLLEVALEAALCLHAYFYPGNNP